jgi:hypothetical protein
MKEQPAMKARFSLVVALVLAPPIRPAVAQALVTAELKPETLAAFERYVRDAEARIEDRLRGKRSFLWIDEQLTKRSGALRGEVEVASLNAKGEVPGGLIHDWIGAVFVPGVTLDRVLHFVRDYDRHKSFYKPEVADSRVLSRSGDTYRILLRLVKKKVITVEMNTEHEVRYFALDRRRWHSRSYSTKIAELEDAGEPAERELPPGRDHGFLWRLYLYWRFEESDGGVWVECEAVSLTRDVPAGLGWLVKPIVRDLPRESLEKTLGATRAALAPGALSAKGRFSTR